MPVRMVDVHSMADGGDAVPKKVSGHVQKMIHLFSNGVLVNGSEPSLTSRNGQTKSTGSTDASKRTLNSQDDLQASPTKVHVSDHTRASCQSNQLIVEQTDINGSPSSYVTSRVISIENGKVNPSQDETDSHNIIHVAESPKTPTYLKLSCALSGYNKYQKVSLIKNDLSKDNSPDNHSQIHVITQSEDNKPVNNSTVQNGHYDSNHVNSEPQHVSGSNACDLVNEDVTLDIHNTSCHESNGASDRSTSQTEHTPTLHPVNNSTSHLRTSVGHSDSISVSDSLVINGSVDISDIHTNSVSESNDVSLVQDGTATPPLDRISPSKLDVHTPNKDAAFFLQATDVEEQKLDKLCASVEADLESNIPDEASGKVRAAVGKATLLTTKKFKQFRGLCNQNMSQSETEPFHTTCQDLAGFWDMVLLQVEDIRIMFEDIDKMRTNGWNSPVREKQLLTIPSSRSNLPRDPTSPRVKSQGPKDFINHTPKSSKAKEAAKARDEARRRLLAAKRAGRQRKASQGEEEVEFFVS